MINPVSSTTSAAATTAAKPAEVGAEDRFLKLLVTQMQNQDPLNPLDNAQVTSQMAQIQTVAGVEKLSTALASLTSSFQQAQALQAAGLIGRDVLVPGNSLHLSEGQGRGAFELAGDASSVQVEFSNAAGQVIDRLNLGALAQGRHHFDWAAPAGSGLQQVSFKVLAGGGATATTYTRDTVGAVVGGADGLALDLYSGKSAPYASVAAVLQH